MGKTQHRDLLGLARECALEAGRLLIEKSVSGFEISKKGRANLVTEVDLLAEELIVERIKSEFSDHQILAEESGDTEGTAPVKWVIDPVDGTTNYAHGYPFYCVSIGVEIEGELAAGVVYDPVADECFSALKNGGAELNGKPIQVSKEASLEESLISTGFSYSEEEILGNLKLFNRMMMRARSVRRDGSAALDLCYVACGRYDGFWEVSLNPWDVAAGGIIVQEAGGRISRFSGAEGSIYSREFLATNGKVHEVMCAILDSASAEIVV